MKEKIEKIKKQAEEELNKAQNIQKLNELKVKYLGKKGELTLILREMGSLNNEERPIIGSLVNQVRDDVTIEIEKKEKNLKLKEINEKLEKENIDISIPGNKISIGSYHPITKIIDEFKEIFIGLRI